MPDHTNQAPFSDPDAERFLETADPDVVLVTDYLTGELSVEQMYAVEARLRDDPGFNQKAAPLIAFWNAPVLLEDLGLGESMVAALTVGGSGDDADIDDDRRMRESWARFLAAIGAPPVPWRESWRTRLRRRFRKLSKRMRRFMGSERAPRNEVTSL